MVVLWWGIVGEIKVGFCGDYTMGWPMVELWLGVWVK